MNNQRTSKNIYRRLAVLAGAGLLAGWAAQSPAAVRTWTGGGDPNFNWSNSANWDTGVPAAGDYLVFGGSTGLENNNDLTAATSFSAVTFASDAGAFVLSGNGIKVGANGMGTGTANGNGGITNLSANLQTFNIEVQNDRSVHYDTTGADIINTVRLWDWRWYKHGPNKLIIANSLTNSANGNILGVDGGVVVFNAQVGAAGVIGHGLKIDTGGTVQIVGPSTDQISSGRDIYMTGGTVQIQTTNELGEPAFEEVPSLKSSALGAVAENGSAFGPVLLGLGDGNSRRGYFAGTIQDGGSGALAIRVKGASWQTFAGVSTYSGTTVVTNNNTLGVTRLIVDGTHTGGGEYLVSGNPEDSTQQAALAGQGSITAEAVNLLDNSFLTPGGVLSSTATTQDQQTATFAESTAILTLNNAVNLASSSSTLDIHLHGTVPGTDYDQIVIGGSGSFSNNNANLQLTIDLGFTPAEGDKFTIVQAPGTGAENNLGVFASLNGIPTDLSQGATFSIGASMFKISYRAEGTTFDAGAGNGNDIMIEALASTSANLTWRGDVNGDWDVQGTPNWRDEGDAAISFANLDNVIFNDGGLVTNVNLTTDLNPAKILVDSAKNYFFTGIGKLTGGMAITKTNTGTLTILTENDNLGSTVIDEGEIQIGDNGVSGAINTSITVNSDGLLTFNRADGQVFHPVNFVGNGKLVHNGSGTLVITNDYSLTFDGITTNSGGTLQFGDGTTGGNAGRLGGLIVVPESSTVLFNFASSAQSIPSSLSGAGNVVFQYASGAQTVSFAGTATNSGFTGTTTVKPYTRLEVTSAAATPAGPIVVESDGFGGDAAYYTHVGGLTNQNAITIAGPGPGGASGPIDTPRGKGALRLGNAWAGAITLSGNATIGASAGTGTILGNISDGGANYTLELLGGTFQIGPDTGVNSYGNTLIMEDPNGDFAKPNPTTVRALNSHPFGSGTVQMVGRTTLQVNGNDVSIPNLVDLPGMAGSNFPPMVVNGSSTAPGTLTVGSDNQSQTFGGLFADGGSQPFSLTKVGAGTFTVTGDNTNTGIVTVDAGTLALASSGAFYQNGQPVLGSGSFNHATLAVAEGASLDVAGRIDGTLTLNNGQVLKHAGASTGAITVNGNVNLGTGTLLLGVNRSGLAHDSLAASGTVTYSGTLAVTNLGAALQAGDSFQLFPSGVSGFTAFNLPVNDLVNNVKYTWNNTVASDGRITVASVGSLVNSDPAPIGSSVENGKITLNWPEDHIGWTLQVQTNSLNVGLSDNWVDVPGSAETNQVTIPINTTDGAVFYRLVYP